MRNINTIQINDVIFVTGGAGFIGFHLSKKLLEMGLLVVGFDNLNDYYDVELKYARLETLKKYKNYKFIKGDLSNKESLEIAYKDYEFNIIINLGAQAGVRYSIDNPDVYIQSNLIGYYNILELARSKNIKHLVYASSSSVYGANTKMPLSVDDKTDMPVSLYAATKKSNELMAYSYCNLYKIKATGLRFFTVYGTFGRPDMAYFSFTKKINNNEKITLFNNGDMYRDFTYVDDVVEAIVKIIANPPDIDINGVAHKVYNIGNSSPMQLNEFVKIIEKYVGKRADIEYLPMQAGDVYKTYADVSPLFEDFAFKPSTTLDEGICEFVKWYKDYYEKKK